MKWEVLTSEEQFDNLIQRLPLFALFKHSTRCSISSMAKNRLERDWDLENIPVYYLDLIKFRSVSNHIAKVSGIEHQSPQLIVFQNGKSIYDASHNSITIEELKAEIAL